MTVTVADILAQGFTVLTSALTFITANTLLLVPVAIALAAYGIRVVKSNLNW